MAFRYPQELVTLSKQTASNSTSIAFTSLINSSFTVYQVRIRDLICATNGTALLLTFSTDNGATYLNSNYKWVARVGDTGGYSGLIDSDSDVSINLSYVDISNTSTKGYSAEIDFYGLNQSTVNPKIQWSDAHYASSGAFVMEYGTGLNTTITPITAVKFAMSSGNITSGTFELYGVALT